jgi:hypothetical protein
VDGVKLIWNPFAPEARALRAEQAGHYGQALRWYARAKEGEERAAERFRYGLPACPVDRLIISAVCALIQLERTALRIGQEASASPEAATSLTDAIEDAADALWRRAHRLSHAAEEASSDVLQTVYDREQEHLQRLLAAIKAFHAELMDQVFVGSSPLQDQAAWFVEITRAMRQPAPLDENDK